MKYERFIATRLAGKSLPGYSRPLVRIAMGGVALSVAVMIMAVFIVTGFQTSIRDKVSGFSGHIQITSYDLSQGYEAKPVSMKQAFYPVFAEVPEITHIQVYATKAGIIRTGEQIEGVVLKGVGKDYDWSFFRNALVRGYMPGWDDSLRSDEVALSAVLARRLDLDTGQEIRMYFVDESGGNMRGRKFTISGIYETGLEEFDRIYVMGDIRHVQRLNQWTDDMVSGFEVFIRDFRQLDRVGEDIYYAVGHDLNAQTIRSAYPQIFDWLKLQDMNVIIILSLMAMVASITMISILLILILERTTLIGILKALGARNWSIRHIFLYQALSITLKGMLIGNLVGLFLAWVQWQYGLIRLPQESYYVPVVPIRFELMGWLILNGVTLLLSMMIMVLPTYLITRIRPVKVITMR